MVTITLLVLCKHIAVTFLLFLEVDRMFCMVLEKKEILECSKHLKILLFYMNGHFYSFLIALYNFKLYPVSIL